MRTDLINEPQIWAMMVAKFPWVEEERGDIGEGLVHLDFAALRHGVEDAADRGDIVAAHEILAFIEELYQNGEQLHPDVVNAMDVSFMKDLYLSTPHQREFAENLLGARTRVRWNEIASSP